MVTMVTPAGMFTGLKRLDWVRPIRSPIFSFSSIRTRGYLTWCRFNIWGYDFTASPGAVVGGACCFMSVDFLKPDLLITRISSHWIFINHPTSQNWSWKQRPWGCCSHKPHRSPVCWFSTVFTSLIVHLSFVMFFFVTLGQDSLVKQISDQINAFYHHTDGTVMECRHGWRVWAWWTLWLEPLVSFQHGSSQTVMMTFGRVFCVSGDFYHKCRNFCQTSEHSSFPSATWWPSTYIAQLNVFTWTYLSHAHSFR